MSSFNVICIHGSTSTSSSTPPSALPSISPQYKWQLEQYQLHTLRSTILSEYLTSRRKIPLHTLTSVTTSEKDIPPKEVDWDCAYSTSSSPKSCLYSFDAEENVKVIAPRDTTQWITLTSLNRLRRVDPTKVEPMWHSQYSILNSWFGLGPYSLLQHVGFIGFIVTNILDYPIILNCIVLCAMFTIIGLTLPVWEYSINRICCSYPLWSLHKTWGKIIHAAFPFKLLIGQMVWKCFAMKLGDLVKFIRSEIIEIECGILEKVVPITVGSDLYEDDYEEEGEEDTDHGYDMDDDEYDY